MSSSGASTATAAASTKICFNTACKEARAEGSRRKGWRLRSGDVAELCDRCSTLYEQGSFCETFHSEGDGWRKCESCGKRLHCGCIVSVSSYALLDAGGIECAPCAQKHFVVVPNQMWSSSSFLFPIASERLKDLPGKSWNQLTSTSPVPGQWRPAPNTWSAAVAAQSELHQRLSYEFDRPNSIEKLFTANRLAISEKKKVEDLTERPIASSINRGPLDRITNGNNALKPSVFNAFHRDEGSIDGAQKSCHLIGDHDAMPTRKLVLQGSRLSSSAGIKLEAAPSPCANIPPGSPLLKDDAAKAVIGLVSPFSSSVDANDANRLSLNSAHRQVSANSFGKQLARNSNCSLDSGVETQNLVRNGRPRMEGRGRSHLLPRYWPRVTEQELQQISGDSNSVITPLFEKMLSASDAGRIGRLVLPKKCAEAYFPAISQPEGLPLKVQDATGKEWLFQFRFWPNNNSRMYVLEGVTPCIQSMQLQAGDTVTFSRIDPEGKLVMGFRKATNTEQVGNGFSQPSEASSRNNKHSDISSLPLRPFKGNSEPINSSNASEHATWSKFDKDGFIQKEGDAVKTMIIPAKRKSSTLGTKSKRLRIENEDSIELKLTWEEAQELLRAPPNCVPSVVVIDGHEIEEYEEAPVLGRPTIFTMNQAGGKDQWAKCEDCLKWRKLPADALLPPRWTCSDNSWDRERSLCSVDQEIMPEQLMDMLPFNTVSHRKSKAKVENSIIEGSDGLDTLANLAILGEGESLNPSQPTTKHPRHRPGCTCIVCIQPPSGKGPKHKQSCTCTVCLTVKRRFRTLMLRKEKRQSEKEAETACKKQQKQETDSPESQSQVEGNDQTSKMSTCQSTQPMASTDAGVDEDFDNKKEVLLSIKTEIDLNIQPEREEEPSPVAADAGSAIILLQSASS